MKNHRFLKILAAFAAAATLAAGLGAAETTLKASADTYVRQDGATTGYGSQKTIRVGQVNNIPSLMRGLVAFDLGSIPPGSKITSATLKIWQSVEDTVSANVNFTVNLIPTHVKAAESGVTWNNTKQAAFKPDEAKVLASNTLWLRSAARGVKLPAEVVFGSTPELVEYLQTTLNNRASKVSFMLVNAKENVTPNLRTLAEFASRNAGNATLTPSLKVEYTPPPASQP